MGDEINITTIHSKIYSQAALLIVRVIQKHYVARKFKFIKNIILCQILMKAKIIRYLLKILLNISIDIGIIRMISKKLEIVCYKTTTSMANAAVDNKKYKRK